MITQPVSGFSDAVSHVAGDIAQALSHRPGEASAQMIARAEKAVQTIMAFEPCDAIEAMVAGHCVVLHELIVDSVRDLADRDAPGRRGIISGIVAMDRAFGANVKRLERRRAAPGERASDVPAAVSRMETEIADRLNRHRLAVARAVVAPARPASEPNGPDADRVPIPARSDVPAPPSVLNRQARREVDRQNRKQAQSRPGSQAVRPIRNEPAARASATMAG